MSQTKRQNDTPVKAWMTKAVITVEANQPVQAAMDILEKETIFGIPVIDRVGHYVGLISKTVIMNHIKNEGVFFQPIADIMMVDNEILSPEDTIDQASEKIRGCLPVVDRDGVLVGIITRTDIIRANSFELEQAKEQIDYAETLKHVLDSAYEGIVVVNRDGYIQVINDAYCRIIDLERKDIIGHHVTEIIENTRLHVIAKTGKAERGYLQRISGQDLIVHRIPIFQNQRANGAIGMLVFKDVSEMNHLLEKINAQNGSEDIIGEQQEKKEQVLRTIIGESSPMQALKQRLLKIAPLPSTILITGSSGTGKEVFARAIHELSQVADGEFVTVNCSAIPDNLLESELFGYEEGAFTDAKRGGKIGKFEQADRGTIFLDEIGDMPLHLQAKLLRVLQEQTIEKVGASIQKKVSVRVIAATHRNLSEMVATGQFREDLYYRLFVIPLTLPDLADRSSDIPALIEYTLKNIAKRYGQPLKGMQRAAVEKMCQYDWPGNIRQLQNFCERMYALAEGPIITVSDLPTELHMDEALRPQKNKLFAENERKIILEALRRTQGNKSEAAKELGIQRGTLYKKIKKYQIVNF